MNLIYASSEETVSKGALLEPGMILETAGGYVYMIVRDFERGMRICAFSDGSFTPQALSTRFMDGAKLSNFEHEYWVNVVRVYNYTDIDMTLSNPKHVVDSKEC